MAAKNTKKKHNDDDLFENETENETAQSPGMSALPAFLAVSMLLLAWRRVKT